VFETRWRPIHDAGLKEDSKANIVGAGGQRKEGSQEGLERDGRPTRLSATRMHGVSAHTAFDLPPVSKSFDMLSTYQTSSTAPTYHALF